MKGNPKAAGILPWDDLELIFKVLARYVIVLLLSQKAQELVRFLQILFVENETLDIHFPHQICEGSVTFRFLAAI